MTDKPTELECLSKRKESLAQRHAGGWRRSHDWLLMDATENAVE